MQVEIIICARYDKSERRIINNVTVLMSQHVSDLSQYAN